MVEVKPTIRSLTNGIFLACILILLYILAKRFLFEGYMTKEEKSSEIHDWWKRNENDPSYRRYKRDLNGSDVIEYNRVKKLLTKGEDVTKGTISSIVS